jgi:hypothetical protein
METAKAAMNRVQRKYNPGLPGRIESQGHGRYIVESFRNSGEFYAVDLEENTCSCPHSIYRNAADCKHRAWARFHSYKSARAKAETMDLETLKAAFSNFRIHYRPEIREAIEFAIFAKERKTASILAA